MLDLDNIEPDGVRCIAPPQLPVTILDIERAEGQFDMSLPMADPCPTCGVTRMSVGDYVCFGECWTCIVVAHN